MFRFCDCSIDPDWTYEEWQEGEFVSDCSRECCECHRRIAVGELYWCGSGIDPESEAFDEDGELTEDSELYRESFVRCRGCHAIAQSLARFGNVFGELAEQVSSCLGFDYRDDPDAWDQCDVDEEDEAHRERALAELAERAAEKASRRDSDDRWDTTTSS